MQNSIFMKLLADGQHSFNIIKQGDLAIGSKNHIRYQQKVDQAFFLITDDYLKSYVLPNLDFRLRQNCVVGLSVCDNQSKYKLDRLKMMGSIYSKICLKTFFGYCFECFWVSLGCDCLITPSL